MKKIKTFKLSIFLDLREWNIKSIKNEQLNFIFKADLYIL